MSESKKKQYVIGAPGCPGCDDIKDALNSQPDIEYLDIQKSDDAVDMITSVGDINAVPTGVEVEDGNVKKCNLKLENNKVVLDCNGESHKLKKFPE